MSRRVPRSASDGPRRLHTSLDALVEDLHGAPRSAADPSPDARALGVLFASWTEIAGPAMARHVAVRRWDAQALLVTADHPAWATKIRLVSDDLLERVRAATGRRPERLEVVVRAR